MNMKKGQLVKVINEEFKNNTVIWSLLVGEGSPSFEGEVLAVNPSREMFATLNDNFKDAVEDGMVPPVVEGVVYFDTGTERAYHINAKDLELLGGEVE
jgi:hypothetical protein